MGSNCDLSVCVRTLLLLSKHLTGESKILSRHRQFVHFGSSQDELKFEKEEHGDSVNSISFSRTCSGCNRRQAAKASYQLLVFKSAGTLDVKTR